MRKIKILYDIQHTSIVNIESGSIHTLEDNVGEANMFDELNSFFGQIISGLLRQVTS
jgi:hypothetical protein